MTNPTHSLTDREILGFTEQIAIKFGTQLPLTSRS